MRQQLHALATSLSSLMFLPGAVSGIIMLVLLTAAPGVLLGAISSWLGAVLAAALISPPSARILTGPVALSPVFTGMGIGHLLAPSVVGVIAAMIAGMAAWACAVAITPWLRDQFRLPPLSLPFVIASVIITLAIGNYPLLPPASVTDLWLPHIMPTLPPVLNGFFISLGSLLFLPHALVGFLLTVLIAWHSRILLFLALAGYLMGGVVRGLGSGNWTVAWASTDGFNPLLVAMAVGGVFLVPSWRSLILALIAAAGCAIVGDALHNAMWWGGAGLPAFTLPFILMTWLTLGLLQAQSSPLLATRIGQTPEITLVEHWAWRLRFPGTLRTLMTPVSGKWTVWQGNDSRWTHQGNQRYALDFVITDDAGKNHRAEINGLDDFYAFDQPVRAPVRGQVVTAIDGLPDNVPGGVDQTHPWGNYVVIHDPRGFFVTVAHLSCGSVAVVVGQWLERGAYLGKCGNSGYSPQPHVHVQVQVAAAPTSATLPFSLVSWWDGARHYANAVPAEGAHVCDVAQDPTLTALTGLILDQQLSFVAMRDERIVGTMRWHVRMGSDGGLFLDSGRGRLHLGTFEGTFYGYRLEGNDPWLRLFHLATARIPLCRIPELAWEDQIPVSALGRSWSAHAAALLGLVHPRWTMARLRSRFVSPWRIETDVGGHALARAQKIALTIDPENGFWRIESENLTLQRVFLPLAEQHHAAP